MAGRPDGSMWSEPLGWIVRHPRTLVLGLFAAATAFPVWRQLRRTKQIRLEPLSQRWLAEHEWEAGRHTELD